MSQRQLQEALELIESAGGRFQGPKPEELIRLAETRLGLKFPGTYREFLSRLGCGHVAGFEIYGLVGEEFDKSTIPNGIWLTLDERKTGGLPNELVLVAETGEGGYYGIDTGRSDDSGESPVVEWDPGFPQPREKLPVVAADFGEFLLNEVKAALG